MSDTRNISRSEERKSFRRLNFPKETPSKQEDFERYLVFGQVKKSIYYCFKSKRNKKQTKRISERYNCKAGRIKTRLAKEDKNGQ